jgi:hypothetical protein
MAALGHLESALPILTISVAHPKNAQAHQKILLASETFGRPSVFVLLASEFVLLAPQSFGRAPQLSR